MSHPVLRVARPTDDLDALLPFYRDGLGMGVLARFEDHDGFDGLVLGHSGAPYHLEFTRADGHAAGRALTQDNLLVLYESDPEAWQAAVDRMRKAGFASVPAFNPWWDQHGATFEPDRAAHPATTRQDGGVHRLRLPQRGALPARERGRPPGRGGTGGAAALGRLK